MSGHDGRSGALIERGVLDDGSPVWVKTAQVDTDAGLLLTGDARRELRLWQEGVFDDFPDGVGTALVGIDDLGDRIVTVTRDLGASILAWDRRLTRDEVRRTFAAVVSVHRTFSGQKPVPPCLCDLQTRMTVFLPERVDAIRLANADLADAVARGHELLADLVPVDIVDALHRYYASPALLTGAMSAPTTLLHGDLSFVNIALEPAQVTPIDWGLATAGPSPIDLVMFCCGAMSNVEIGRDDLLAEARDACRGLADDATFALCEFWALVESGWNKALDAVDHPDEGKREIERGDLEFWTGRARMALERGLVPESPVTRMDATASDQPA